MTPEQPRPHARSRRIVVVGLCVALLAIPLIAFALRFIAHSRYLHDSESLMFPTVGRELSHGHWRQMVQYQFNLYQGGVLIDGALYAIGFKLFGDGLMAWKWVSFLYVAGLVGFGALVLRRTAGIGAAVLFPLLMAAAPFVVKDGLITSAGQHTFGCVWALAALAVAVGGKRVDGATGPASPSFVRGVVAGAIFGVGAFYARSVLAAGPALVVALLPGGWRPLLGMAVGSLLFPLTCMVDAWAFSKPGAMYEGWGFWLTLKTLMWSTRAQPAEPVALMTKFGEATSIGLQRVLFNQPAGVAAGVSPSRPEFAAATTIWARTLFLAPFAAAALAAMTAIPRLRKRLRGIPWGAAVVVLVAGAYISAYVFSPFRVDPPALADFTGPDIASPRYVLPAYIALTMVAAWAMGVSFRTRWLAPLGAIAAVLVIGAGLRAAASDWTLDQEPPGTMTRLAPFEYFGMYGPHRGPPTEVHLDCDTTDPISRANHLRTAGWRILTGVGHLDKKPEMLVDLLAALLAEHPMPEEDVLFVAQGMGIGLCDSVQGVDLNPEEMLAAAMVAAELMEPARRDALLSGVAWNLHWGDWSPEQSVFHVCAQTPRGDRPLCYQLGQRYVRPDRGRLPEDPSEMLNDLDPGVMKTALGPELARGAAIQLVIQAPWTRRGTYLDSWDPTLARAFRSGWNEGATRKLYHRDGGPYTPAAVP